MNNRQNSLTLWVELVYNKLTLNPNTKKETIMTDQAKLSEKVTPALLDRMYNNFVKITDWVVKGKESQYPLPKALAGLFDAAEQAKHMSEQNSNEIAELKSLITTLQSNLIDKEQRITALDGALQSVNATLKQLVGAVNEQQAPASSLTTPTLEPAPQEQQPTPTQAVVDELVDLDDVIDTTPAAAEAGEVQSEQVSPNEQAIQVSAEAVDAGNIDPASYQALDAEIDALLGSK